MNFPIGFYLFPNFTSMNLNSFGGDEAIGIFISSTIGFFKGKPFLPTVSASSGFAVFITSTIGFFKGKSFLPKISSSSGLIRSMNSPVGFFKGKPFLKVSASPGFHRSIHINSVSSLLFLSSQNLINSAFLFLTASATSI